VLRLRGGAKAFESLFGANLVDGKGGAHKTAEKLTGVDGVMVYFSAHWCPPCRGFTPKLAESYTKMKAAGKNFETVFVSSDRDQAAFDEYAAEMPWLALPYSERELKGALSKKYKVRGIPSLVILDGAGELITAEGRSEVTADPEGKMFPWIPQTLGDVLGEMTELQKAFSDPIQKADLAGKTIGLYFSAHWCGPCRGFTPELVKTYNAMKAAGNEDFEIIFVSSDRDQAAFDEYFAEMPWLALPYGQRDLKESLSKACKVQGIPTLIIIGPDGTVINEDGRSALSKDKTGASFPWHPPAYTDLEDSSSINDEPTVIAFVEGCSAEVRAAVEAGVKAVAEAAGKDSKVKFTVAGPDDGLAGRVRKLAKLGDAGAQPLLALIDLDDSKSYYTAAAAETYDQAAIEGFVAAFTAGTLEKKTLEF